MLRRSDFAGVQAGVDPDDCLALPGELARFGFIRLAQRQAAADPAVEIELFEILRRRDVGDIHRLSHRCLAEFGQYNAVRSAGQLLEVGDDFVVVGELVVVSGSEAEVLLGRGYSRVAERGGEEDDYAGSLHRGGGAVEGGAGFPSTVPGSISSTRVPSGSNRFNWRFRLTPVLTSIGRV